MANDIAWLTPQGWGVRFPSKFEALTSTRDLLDCAVRRRPMQLPNVNLLHGCEVKSLRGRANLVEGVNLNFRAENGRGASTDFLRSEFVVVATGRNSSAPKWLRGLGLPEPETSRVDAQVGSGGFSRLGFSRHVGDPLAGGLFEEFVDCGED